MAKRAYVERPIVPKIFKDKLEIERAIEKIQRRIVEVQNLKQSNDGYNEQDVKNTESNIRETIREVFGNESPEFHEHEHHQVWEGRGFIVPFGDHYDPNEGYVKGIPKTLKMLEGLIARLNEKKLDFDTVQTVHYTIGLESLDIHPRIKSASEKLFSDGHYADAVFNASKSLINYVKEKSGRHDLDGANLMRTVFSPNKPIVSFNSMRDQTDKDEQEGLMHLFEGAVLAIRNPRGHSVIYDTAGQATEYLCFLSLLAKKIDKCV